MARRDVLVPRSCPCGDDCCAPGTDPVPLPPRVRPARSNLLSVLKIIGLGVIAFLAATLGCAFFASHADAQQITVDSSTPMAQHHMGPSRLTMIQKATVKWGARLGLKDWRVTIQADSLPGMTVAQTHTLEPYRWAIIIVDLRGIDSTNVDEIMLHELWHVRLSSYTTTARITADTLARWHLQQREEALVTDLTRAMLWR